ncbi:MAG: enoyl-CoA hydratase/isomerase family protein [Candidatus Adiutricales bacterium]
MSYEMILTETRGRVGIITFNRPEKLNALHATMSGEMRDQITVWNNDPNIGAIVLTGAGRAFCSGADIGGWNQDIEKRERGEEQERRRDGSWVIFARDSKPLICAINGPCIGAGLTITLPCDIRIASDQARLSMRFIRVGIFPELASTHLLSHIVGFGQAMELMLTGKIIEAEEAGRIGLVNRVVPQDKLLDEAVATAQEIAFNPAESVMAVKKIAWQNLDEGDISVIQQREGVELAAAIAKPAFKEAVRAFLEKRQPDFNKM